jgi:hypothetical protein
LRIPTADAVEPDVTFRIDVRDQHANLIDVALDQHDRR